MQPSREIAAALGEYVTQAEVSDLFAEVDAGQSTLWKLEHEGRTAYLFGSVQNIAGTKTLVLGPGGGQLAALFPLLDDKFTALARENGCAHIVVKAARAAIVRMLQGAGFRPEYISLGRSVNGTQ